jgi:membrane protein DedA with SNARE-associated domain
MPPRHFFTSPLVFLSHTPLSVFVLLSSFLEEIFSPIPSAFVTIATGSYALTHHRGYVDLVILAILSGIGKTAAAYLYYVLADKGEDIVLGKYGKYIGISHASVEKIGKLLDKTKRDDIILLLTRAFPLFPTAPVSFFCGLIKQNLKTYLMMSLLGFTIRSFLYLLIGYLGIDFLSLLHSTSMLWFSLVIIMIMLIAVVLTYRHQNK